jgi:hypothetical protein
MLSDRCEGACENSPKPKACAAILTLDALPQAEACRAAEKLNEAES